MTTACEKHDDLDINRFIEDLTAMKQNYCAHLKQIFGAKGKGAPNTNKTFTTDNPHFIELACIYADAFRLARGAIYEINKSLGETAIWFDKAMKSPEVQFPFPYGEMPAMVGERFQDLLKAEIDRQISTKSTSPEMIEVGDEEVDVIQKSVRKKFGLKDLRYAVIAAHNAMHNRINRELLEDSGSKEHIFGLSPQITVRAWSVENAWNALDCLVECRQEGKEADIDVIFLSTSLPYKRGKNREINFVNVQRFLREFEEGIAEPEAAPYFRNTKIVIIDENLDPDILKKLQEESARVLGGINMTTEESNLPVPVALAGLLADKSIIVLDLKYIDAQLRLHADNFNRAVRNLIKEKNIDRHKIWDDETFLREMHSLINAYRVAEGLEPIISQTKGCYCLYVFIMEEIRQGISVPPSSLFEKNDTKGPYPTVSNGVRKVKPSFKIIDGDNKPSSDQGGREPVQLAIVK